MALGGFIWSFISLAGVSQLLRSFPFIIQWIAYIGGSYLCYLGLKTLKGLYFKLKVVSQQGDEGEVSSEKEPTKKAHSINEGAHTKKAEEHVFWQDMIKGLVTTLSNPKVALLWLSMSSIIPLSKVSEPFKLLLPLISYSVVIGLIVFSVYGVIALLFSASHAQHAYLKHENVLNLIFAMIFLSLGSYIIFSQGWMMAS